MAIMFLDINRHAEAARLEAGDLLLAEQESALSWGRVHSLKDVITGSVTRSQLSDVTLFKSVGLALAPHRNLAALSGGLCFGEGTLHRVWQ